MEDFHDAKPTSTETSSEMNSDLADIIKSASSSLESIFPESNVDDMRFLEHIVGNARLVGMGEANHGSSEFTLVRHKALRMLAERMEFNGLILECPKEEAEAVNSFITSTHNQIDEVIDQLPYWVHRTQEMKDVITWMKEFNQDNPEKQLSFMGCDIPVDDKMRYQSGFPRDKAMADITKQILDQMPDKKFVLWSHNFHIGYINNPEQISQGQYLKDALDEEYVSVGTLASRGTFNAVSAEQDSANYRSMQEFNFECSNPDSIENVFSQTGQQYSITDLRVIRSEHKDDISTMTSHLMIGASFDPSNRDSFESKGDFMQTYDAVLFVDTISPSNLLRKP